MNLPAEALEIQFFVMTIYSKDKFGFTLGPKMAEVEHCQQRFAIFKTSDLRPTHCRQTSSVQVPEFPRMP